MEMNKIVIFSRLFKKNLYLVCHFIKHPATQIMEEYDLKRGALRAPKLILIQHEFKNGSYNGMTYINSITNILIP